MGLTWEIGPLPRGAMSPSAVAVVDGRSQQRTAKPGDEAEIDYRSLLYDYGGQFGDRLRPLSALHGAAGPKAARMAGLCRALHAISSGLDSISCFSSHGFRRP